MTELEINLNAIKTEIAEKVIPENIKKGITLFGVEGTLEEGSSIDYVPLLYIQSSGSQYIDTGIVPTNHKLEIQFQFNNTTDNKAIFGSDVVQYSTTYFSHKWYTYFNGKEASFSLPLSVTDLQTLIFNDENNKVTINGTAYVDTGDTTNVTRSILLLTRVGVDGSHDVGYTSAKIYYVKITDKSTGKLVRDMIPVKSPDGTICMYDKVSKTYFYNQGTGTFTAGI
jgi:hypothetical protein